VDPPHSALLFPSLSLYLSLPLPLLLRSVVEEATTALEALAPQELQLDTLLPGKWRLEYTTALDVVRSMRRC
jgi:PAP_fibrillin